LEQVSGTSPFAGCTADNVAAQPGTVYPNSEVEPWIAASGTDRNGDGEKDIIGGYQQDRWSNGGSRGVYASAWFNGAWVQVAVPGTSACVGGSHLRATDPWVTFSPDGSAYFFTLATSAGNDSALLVNKSTDGGLSWGPPISLIDEDSVFNFNDKNSITADPFDSRYVYAIWDRSNFPSDKREVHSIEGFPRSIRSDVMLSRTTDGGETWETPRAIFAPRANQFSIGHEIVVLSDGTLLDSFMLFHGYGANKKGQEVAVMISKDHGATWSKPITVAKALPGFVADPDDGTPLRTGDIIPEVAAGPDGSAYSRTWRGRLLSRRARGSPCCSPSSPPRRCSSRGPSRWSRAPASRTCATGSRNRPVWPSPQGDRRILPVVATHGFLRECHGG
jgi:hypothetical protein